jgi:beta-glucosidase
MNKQIIFFCLFFVSASVCTPGFPPGFLWGSATASYQVEGAYNISRGLSIWDTFSHTPGKTRDGDTGDVADDHYHRYEEDIALMKSLGLKNYRLSIAWPRLFPNGTGAPNQAGIAFYDRVINELLRNGISPFVTLYHWDLPDALHTTYGGWLNVTIVGHFAQYAETAFRAFGDRVKHWITFNEPLSFTNLGYGYGTHAPGRCSDRSTCTAGNSSTEPYIAAHHVLLAHARAVDIYRRFFQPQQKGIIGITLNIDWAEPLTNSSADLAASERHIEWQVSWYADPIFKGDYPLSMRQAVGARLPVFTPEEKKLLLGSWDYFGMNHYTSGYVSDNPEQTGQGWDQDQKVTVSHSRKGVLIGPVADSSWLFVVPWGIYKMLHWVARRYDSPPIYITENGVSVPNENNLPLAEALNDQFRVDFYSQYISNVSLAISEGVDVKGYFAWSLMDNFEWADGYSVRFGLHYVDYKNGLKRYQKNSAKWYSNLINS